MTLTDVTLTGSWKSLGTYERYDHAQRVVDALADKGFPVDKLAIVGRDLRTVERVTGRLTAARASLLGLTAGAWWGVFVGVLLAMFTPGLLAPVAVSTLLGAAFGAALGWTYWVVIGKTRSFTSVHALGASRYELLGTDGVADEARRALNATAVAV